MYDVGESPSTRKDGMEFLIVASLIVIVASLIGWVGSVIVLFSKGQTAWAVTGIFLGWSFLSIPWIVAAAVTPNLKAIAAMDRKRRHNELLAKRRKNAERRKQELAASSNPPPITSHGPTPEPVMDTSVDGRLATIDRLLEEAKITQEEHAEQRRTIIRDI